MTVEALIASVALVALNGFFVAVEFSLMASRRTKVEPLAEAGLLRARVARRVLGALPVHLTACTVGVTVASLGLGAVAEPTLGGLLERALRPLPIPDGLASGGGFAIAFALVVFAHLVVGELAPKYVALASPERVLLALVIPFRAVAVVMTPIVWVLAGAARTGVRLVGVEPRDELATAASAEDLAVMLAASREQGLIKETAHDLLAGALDFGAQPVVDVMVPIDRVVSITRETTAAEAEEIAVTTGLSRLPVADPDLDHIVGFLHVKDLLAIPHDARTRPVPLSRIRRDRKMLRVRAGTPIDAVLLSMRRARIHLAAVENEAEHTIGIVSLEDIVEELVGDIRDESDRPPRPGPGPM